MVREKSHMFITGPDVVKTVTGEEVTLEELGGAKSHSSKSGVATFVADTEQAVLDEVKFLLSFLPANNLERAAVVPTDRRPRASVPRAVSTSCRPVPNLPYDMKAVIAAIVDDGEFMEYFASWARSIVCGFARLDGHAVGVVGNQPMVLAGVLDIDVVGEGGPLRPHLRRLQHPAAHLRRRARLPARRRPGVRRHHPPRSQAAVRLLRGHRAPHPGHHPQGLRRRLRGDGLQVGGLRSGLRLALGRAGRDGAPGRGRDHPSP